MFAFTHAHRQPWRLMAPPAKALQGKVQKWVARVCLGKSLHM
jgi:hypothetical protein